MTYLILVWLFLAIVIVNRPSMGVLALALAAAVPCAVVYDNEVVRLWLYYALALVVFAVSINLFVPKSGRQHSWLIEHILPVFYFALLIVFGAFVLPVIFDGLQVFEARQGMDFNDQSLLFSLRLTVSNVAQSIFLLINVGIYCFVLWRGDVDKKEYYLAILVFLYAVSFLFIWQFLAVRFGVPFPEYQIRNGTNESVYRTEVLQYMGRLNAGFAEPSVLGLAGGVMFGCGLGFLRMRHTCAHGIVFLISAFMILRYSGSSTAFVSIGAAAAGFVLLCVLRREYFLAGIATSIFACGALSVFMWSSGIREAVGLYVFDKQDTSSFENRFYSVVYSFELWVKTFGLGVGLGSNRPSSLFTLLISCLGFLSIPCVYFLVIYPLRRVHCYSLMTCAYMCGYMGLLAGVAVSVPDLSNPVFTLFASIALGSAILDKKRPKIRMPSCVQVRIPI